MTATMDRSVGTHLWVAHKRYRWIRNEHGKLEAVPDPPEESPTWLEDIVGDDVDITPPEAP